MAQTPGCAVRVSGVGDITLPLIGRIKVAGLTVEQAQTLVGNRLVEGRFYKNPQVTILQKEYSTQGISVLGEVQKPGIYPLLGPHTLMEAISMAGGTTIKAGNDVTITHRSQPNQSEHVVMNKDPTANVAVRPGDVVSVSKAGIVYVVGDVKLPSGVVMGNSGLTVLQAVAMAQGANSTASLDNSKLIRSTPQGKEEIPIPLKKILSSKAADVELQPGDILFIPNSAAKSAGRRGMEAILQTATGLAIYRR
jgi:polysaccharide export outer membrane protein